MSPQEFEARLTSALARTKGKLAEQHATPILTVGIVHAPNKDHGNYAIVFCQDEVDLQTAHALLSSMLEQVNFQLGIT